MTNYYLKGFKLGFQPERATANLVYQKIIRREPDFLQKQIPAGLSKTEQENFGRYEGEFLSDEITVRHQQVEFSDLAQQLLFDKKPKEVEVTPVTKTEMTKDKPKKQIKKVVPTESQKIKVKVPENQSKKEDESLWEL